MAFNSNIKGYMTFGKSFSRGSAFPLEAYEIWTDYDALVAYAANTDPNKDPSYIGQKVAYVDVENNKVTHYGIEIDGTLKELGATPIGDEKSIVVDESNYTISLKGVDGLVFERDILDEDGEPTGDKEEVKFQPLMTKDGLVWVEPSKTTVEGLATLLSELTTRVKALEDDRVTEQELADAVADLQGKIDAIDFVDNDDLAEAIKDFVTDGELESAIADFATTGEVADAVAAEKALREAAEKALGERIDAIDFIDEDELATELAPYAKTTDVQTALADKADKTALEELKGTVDAFLTGDGTEAALDSLKELIAYIDSHDDVDIAGIMEDIQAIENKLVGIDGTVADYVTAAINALKIGDYAKASDLAELVGRVEALEEASATHATKAEVEAVDAKFADYTNTESLNGLLSAKADADKVVSNDTFAQFQSTNEEAIEAARTGAVADVAEVGYALAADVAKDYVTKTDLDTRIGTPGVPAEVDSDGNEVTPAVAGTGIFASAYSRAEIDKLLDEVQGGSSASADSVLRQLNTYKSTNDERVTNIEAKDTAQDTAIQNAQSAATAAATAVLTLENGTVAQHTSQITAIDTRLTGVETTVGGHTTELATLTGKVNALVGEDTAINAAIEELAGNLATESGTRASEDAKITALVGGVSGRVDAVEATLTGVPADKTVVELINEAKTAATYDDTAVKKLISDEAARADAEEKRIVGLVEAEAATARAAEKKNADDIVAINALLNTISDTDDITSLKELALWFEEHETEVLPVINGHTAAINALNTKVDTGEKTVSAYVTDAIAAIPAATASTLGLVKASAEVTVASDGTLGLGEVSTDKLVQGIKTLILDGGDAEIPAN